MNQALYTWRQALGHDAFIADSDRISLAPDQLTSDYEEFSSAMEQGTLDRALTLYGGTFLAGHTYISDEFEDWRLAVASRLELDALRACEHQLSWAINAGSPSDVSRFAEIALSINPLNASFVRARVIALASQGDASTASRELELARLRFKTEVGSVPAELAESIDAELSGNSREHSGFERRSLPIVGRDQELLRIRTQWERAKANFAVVVVQGEPGIGKSRVFQQTLRRAAIDGGRLFVYSCAEVEAALPYSVAAGLLRDGRRHLTQAKLSPDDRAVLASIVPELFPGAPGVSQASRLRVFEAVARAWQEVAREGPMVIAVDDYQWIDQGSLELLGYIQKRLAESPILLLTAGRGTFSPVLYEDEQDKSVVFTLPLLNDEDCESLISHYESRHGCTVDRATRDWVKRKVGGRPLLLVEVLHNLRMGNADPGSRVESAIVSPTLNATVARRLLGLSSSARQMTAAASVLNREIPLFDLARIADFNADIAAGAADEMIASNIVGDGRTIRFSHDLLRDIVFHGLSHPQRVRWHYRIAQHLVASQSIRYAEIAFHFEEAGDRESAFKYAKLSVEEAERFSAYKDVDEAYSRMLRCASAGQRESVSIQLFRHLVSLGRLKEAHNLIDAAAAAFKSRHDNEGLLLCEIVQYAGRVSDSVGGNGGLGGVEAIIRLAETHNPERLSTVLGQLADPIRSSGDCDLLRRFATCLVEYSTKRADDKKVSADVLCAAALVGLMSIGYEFAEPLAKSAVSLASATSDASLLARALYARGTVAVCSGDLHQAQCDYEELLRKWSEVLPDDVVTRIKSNYSIVLMERGAYDEASMYGRMALREAGIARRSYAFGNLALIGLRKGDYEGATRYATALLESHPATGLAWVVPHARAILGLVKLATGAVGEAREHARQAKNGLRAAEGIMDCSPIYELCGRVELLDGNPAGAIEILNAGIENLGHMDRLAAERLRAIKAKSESLLDSEAPDLRLLEGNIEQKTS